MKIKAVSARHTKINKIEKLKAERSYQEAWEALQRYAKEGYDAIAKEDMDFFLKCFGIFDRPATPGKFMIRVRIPGGRLTSQQAKTLGEAAKTYGNDYMDLTTRMQVQLRYLDIADIPTLIETLESVGITTWQTGVDNFRNIVTDPLDGLCFDSVIETAPLIEKMQSLWLKKPEWIAAIPRKFNTAIGGTGSNRCNLFAHDCCFALANREGEYGFNVYLGGKVGAIAESADIFVTEEEIFSFYEALMKVYKKYGFRDSRNKNRLHFLIKEAGMEALVEAIKDMAQRDFAPAGETLVKQPRTEERDGRIRLKDGTYALHMVVPSGIFSGTAMMEAAQAAETYGNGSLNISTTQNLFILGVAKENIEKLLAQPPYDKYSNRGSAYTNQMVACAGIELCPFGVIPNKSDAIDMANYLEEAVPLPEDAGVRMHWSACVKGCGVHELGDIGFIGCKAKENGQTVYGVHIQLGGKSTISQEEAYTILKTVPLTRAKHYVAELMRAYRDLRNPKERFEQFESRVFRRYTKGAIEFILRWNVEVATPKGFEPLTFHPKWTPNIEHNEIFELGTRLYKTLTGQNPYQGTHLYNPIETTPAKHPSKLNPSIDKGLGDIIMKMIALSSKRYEVFTEVIHAIEEWARSNRLIG
ncbi:nitrite/sulfite reductase [Hydrogenimonas urashimensis]|uniref:nitrite/sulfite reductase n=1 Tax=Hydrogenimonas urashimensis TaxID=2740515 RepID=UPI001916581D|nr:ferredoxin--nitrite reductase [Hydrogenimonas urashimensis]